MSASDGRRRLRRPSWSVTAARQLPRIQLWRSHPVTATTAICEELHVPIEPMYDRRARARNPDCDSPDGCGCGATSFVTPVRVYDVDLASGERDAAARASRCSATTGPRTTYERRRLGNRPDGDARVPVSDHPSRAVTSVPGTHAAVRIRRLRSRAWTLGSLSHVCRLLDRGMVFADRARARRRRDGPPRGTSDGKLLQKTNTFTDFVACRASSRRHRCDPAPRVLSRSAAAPGGLLDRCGGQHGAGVVRRVSGPGAVRRPAHNHPRPVAAAHRDRVGRVGKPVGGQERLPLHEVLLARTRTSRARTIRRSWPMTVAQRHPGATTSSPRNGLQRQIQGRRPPGAVEDRDERRPRWYQRALRALEGGGLPVRVATGCRQGRPRQAAPRKTTCSIVRTSSRVVIDFGGFGIRDAYTLAGNITNISTTAMRYRRRHPGGRVQQPCGAEQLEHAGNGDQQADREAAAARSRSRPGAGD